MPQKQMDKYKTIENTKNAKKNAENINEENYQV